MPTPPSRLRGSLGLRTYVAGGTTNSPVLISFDDFRVTSLGAPNQAPVFSTDFTNRTDAEGAVISLDANATDPDGNPLTYSATNLPSGITINASSGVISGTLSATSSGTYNVVITVSDGSLTDTDPFTWTVTEPVVNQAPVFSTDFTNRTDAEGAVISLDANATDPDGNPLTYSATNLPSGITINASSGVISGTLSATSSGIYNVVITVSDGSLTDTDPFTWTVTEPSTVTTYVDDSFGRTSTNTWGSAPTGGTYTLGGNAADYDVTGGFGTISMPAPGATRSALLNVSATEVDFSFRVRSDKAAVGGNQYLYGVVRRNGANEYRVKLRFAPNGAVFVGASTVINNVETNIGTEVQVPGLTHAANAIIRFRAQVTGTNPTTLRVRAWADAAVEPTTWQYSATNANAALQAARLAWIAHLRRRRHDQFTRIDQLRRLPSDECLRICPAG